MAKHIVKCMYCQESFDTNTEPFEKPRNNRYAHKACYDAHISNQSPLDIKREEEERDYHLLEDYIKNLFNEQYVSAQIKKQISDYKKQYGYTYSGILKTLQWWYELKQNKIIDVKYGIGIVPYVYKEACDYYYNLYLADIANKEMQNYSPQIKKIRIKTPKCEKKHKKHFAFEEVINEQE